MQRNSATVQTAMLNFAAISRQGLTVIQNELGIGSVGNAQIQANAVRTNELYVDGDVNFAADASYHAIYGCDGIYFGASGVASHSYLALSSDNLQLGAQDGQASIYAEEIRLDTVGFGGTGNIILDADDEIHFQLTDGTIAKLQEIVANDALTFDIGHEGYMKFDVGGVTRYLAFRTT